jgi:bifunctional non-homologous end joining protein LigD
MLDAKIPPMLAYSSKPFDSPDHLFEIKWDGTRSLLFIRDGEIRLQNRRLQDITARYPDLKKIYRQFKAVNAIVDGELVALTQGRADFPKLQQREQLADALKIELAARRLPVTYMAFDLLYLNGEEFLSVPLLKRKQALQEILRESDQVLESKFIREQGRAFFREAVAQGLEGIMGKAVDSPYLPGRRSRHWLKVKPRKQLICHIVGFTPGQGGRQPYFGSLALASPEPEGWKFRGLVGSGFSLADLKAISRRLGELRVAAPPRPGLLRSKDLTWVRPDLKCKVSYQEETARGHFRAPAFMGLVP